ncbi:hypothetical protein [Microbacterium sp. MYb62]|uniref:hypothetical protein n=1 Tax=Microbacterium sp. MYb62 TaxID=1848690 RepID=UPI000CFB0C56|nr:hypothetical protein [Microbacterium sp. MYb62]PRB14118.1 hypothetical protein CQ042_11565 [Microbacterium sp. MYb62]
MRRRALFGASLLAGLAVVTGCGALPPVTGPDRSEVVPVTDGTCEISWWLGPAVDDPPAEAGRVAAEALEEATVSESQWSEWYRLLDDDPDLDSLSENRLRGSAYLEAVREDVRAALDDAGYPDIERVIEVYSDLSCA